MENKVWSQEFCASCWFIYILQDDTRCTQRQRVVPCLGTLACLRKGTISFILSVCLSVCLSVRMEQLGSHCINLMKFGICLKSVVKIKFFFYNMTKITDTLHEDLCTFVVACRWIILRMRNVSDKRFTENQCVLCSVTLNCTVYGTVCKKYGRAGQTGR